MTNDERMQRESDLIATIRKKLPEFARACAHDTALVLLRQDALAADYQEDEYTLLGLRSSTQVARSDDPRCLRLAGGQSSCATASDLHGDRFLR